jgi:signal transduction histidine kinase
MQDRDKNKAQLIEELDSLRHRVTALERNMARDARLAEEASALPNLAEAPCRQVEESLQDRVRELNALSTLSRQVSVCLSLDGLVQAALEGIAAPVAPDFSVFFLRNGDNLLLQGYQPHRLEFGHATAPVHCVGECLCGLAVSGKEPIYCKDIHRDPRCTWEECKKAGLRSFAALPLLGGEEVLGVLGIATASVERDFAQQASFLETLSHEIATGLQNALLYEQVKQHGDEVAGRNERLKAEIAERKLAEAEREKLIAKLEAQNAELERFTYTVSHDLKSPLITITGYVGMLRQDLAEGDSETVANDLDGISNAAEKMNQLLGDLLELSRIGRLVNLSEHVSLEGLAREALELVVGQAKEKGVRIEISPDLPEVFGDRVRLLEVLQNLIDNAVKYMGDEPRPQVNIGVRLDGNEPVFFVRDNGIGIEPVYHERVFGLFDQLDQKADGSGIGLALVKRIVEMHGGRIWVESEGAGHGSTFCFTFAATTPIA